MAGDPHGARGSRLEDAFLEPHVASACADAQEDARVAAEQDEAVALLGAAAATWSGEAVPGGACALISSLAFVRCVAGEVAAGQLLRTVRTT